MSDQFASRLETLEKENRQLRRAVLLLAVIGAAAFVMGARHPRTIDAERMILRDSEGRTRGEFGLTDGRVRLEFRDSAGKPHLRLDEGEQSGTVEVLGSTGLVRVRLSGEPESAGVELFDEGEKLRAGLIASVHGANLSILESDGTPRVFVGSDSENGPQVALHSRGGKVRVQLAMNDCQEIASLQLKDENGNVRALVRVDEKPAIGLFDERGDWRWVAELPEEFSKTLVKAPPKQPDCVIQIFESSSDIGRPFEELCQIVGKGAFGKSSMVDAYKDLRRKACACGADGVIYLGSSTWPWEEQRDHQPPEFFDGHSEVQGLAIRFEIGQ